jgi:hypothetical protein
VRPTLLAVDVHAHLYPAHRVDRWLSAALANLSRLGGNEPVERVAFLADTARAEGFSQLAGTPVPGHDVVRVPGSVPALVVSRAGERLHVLPGRQLVTRERVEVLALGTGAALRDGLSLGDTLAAVRAAGATAVLPWSPGKWLGRRGRLVAAALEGAGARELAVADTSLRPAGLPLPPLLRRARRLGIPLLAGSDPLPPRGEEGHVGSYGVAGPGAEREGPAAVADAALALLAGGGRVAGRRSGLPVVLWRLARHRRGAGRAAGSAR